MFELILRLAEQLGVSPDDAVVLGVYATWIFLVAIGFSLAFFIDGGRCIYKLVKKGISAIRSKLRERKRGT